MQTVFTENQADAFAHYQQQYQGSASGSSMAQYVTADQMQDSLRVKLNEPEHQNIDAVISSYQGQQGVAAVPDEQQLLQPLFTFIHIAEYSATAVAMVMLVPGVPADLQHGPALRVQPEAGDGHHAAGRRLELLHPDAVPARRRGGRPVGGVAVGDPGRGDFKAFLIDRVVAPQLTSTSSSAGDRSCSSS